MVADWQCRPCERVLPRRWQGHGVKGGSHLIVVTLLAKALEHGIILRNAQGREIWIVKLRGVDSLTESETLRGQTLLVSSTDRPELEDEDEFLVQVSFASRTGFTLVMYSLA